MGNTNTKPRVWLETGHTIFQLQLQDQMNLCQQGYTQAKYGLTGNTWSTEPLEGPATLAGLSTRQVIQNFLQPHF